MNKISKFLLAVSLFIANLIFVSSVFAAEDSVTLSVSPPLSNIVMQPGQTWQSSITVVNNNAYPTVIYAQVLDFVSGQDGGVEFLPEGDQSHARYSLSKWLKLGFSSSTVPAYGKSEVPFTLVAPQDADPGGHYAAIMIGNKPFDQSTDGTAIKFSTRLAALLLVKFDGEVKESGEIKEFKTDKSIFTDLDGNFTVRFANTGNVHIKPAGMIKISNIFGQVRGEIQINKSSDYGNVLPESDKVWKLNWRGTNPLLDAGPLKAELLINYGSEVKASATSKLIFWTINLRLTVLVVGAFLLLFLLIGYLLRTYIKKSISTMKSQLEAQAAQGKKSAKRGRPKKAQDDTAINEKK